jgi:hypothetical protein
MGRAKRSVFLTVAILVLVTAFSHLAARAEEPVPGPAAIQPALPPPVPFAV